MMKSLQTIQKTFRAFQTLVRIAMVASFVWAGLSVLGLLCAFAWYSGVTVVGLSREVLLALTLTGSLSQMVGVLLADAAFALTDGVLLLSAFRYFKAEQEAGTPFTRDGADAIRTLGIRTIVLLLAAAVFSTLTYEFFGLATAMVVDWDNLVSVSLGLVMILASLVFRYGAELEGEAVTQG